MLLSSLLLTALPLAANTINVVQSNDDGWAMINIRELHRSLTDAGFSSIISAPADNKSGKGSKDAEPVQVGHKGCQFGSCPSFSPPYGNNASEPQFNYVNSYPVTAMRHGIQNLSQTFFAGPPDIALSGPNAGNNLRWAARRSGTVGAAVEAAELGVPAIAFSGPGHYRPWTDPVQPYMEIYSELSTIVVEVLTNGSKPYLPDDTILNVNYPHLQDVCESVSDVNFVLTRVFPRWVFRFLDLSPRRDDVEMCGSKLLPDEQSVVRGKGCHASISVMSTKKKDVDAEKQRFVADRLGSILTCLPGKRRKGL
ncbi:Acid phosphatase [Fulvia fulva]|uniref:Acid phosphatase n=1 Tax=Passalora fulva TaxID=5499 RepID=A0A9Q8PGZ3_PASFU|nr:Acid phosphatase [Fulvia fulva]KAK4613695.1 Acid phosphatase [Fulvia fulva]KAK4615166.1 Acid phosphatase [Fulvia fulva]UJO22237.1 Acid phosphatase [Fulvia fulva]WPV19955.1 Acid phosphatase [Fulvia fulva]WPV35318.1 Acid phosphatase [Fulvia fulva]